LAIELAAGRVDAFGVRGLAARLDDRFRLLTHGRRTALPRHQTLSATLDWSYEHLPESERWVLRRLAVFAGGFTLDAAQAITASTDIDAGDIADHVANLVAKSLITADVGNSVVHYRLLETMRVYGLGKLKESGESELFARRHAEYFRDLFERAETEWESRPATEWLTAYGRQIDNVRTAGLGIFAQRRYGARRRADDRRSAALETLVADGGMPQSRPARARQPRTSGALRHTPGDEALDCAGGRCATTRPRALKSRRRGPMSWQLPNTLTMPTISCTRFRGSGLRAGPARGTFAGNPLSG